MTTMLGHQPVTPRVQDKSTLPERILDRIFTKKVIINCDHDPYLHRWIVFKTRLVTLFIHKFVRSDEDRALHDHPWNFLVIPIWRGYMEHSEWPHKMLGLCHAERRVYPIIGARFRRATYRHRVELLPCPLIGKKGYEVECKNNCNEDWEMPAWSLFFHFKRWREWGFWEPDFIHWQKWWSDKCE